MRNSCKIISVVLALIIILGISPAAYAEEVMDATITYMDIIPPLNSESSEETQLYSCSPTHLFRLYILEKLLLCGWMLTHLIA